MDTRLKVRKINSKINQSLSAEGLSFSNCTYESGGYFKLGNLVIINIRVNANKLNWGTNIISGFPTPEAPYTPCSMVTPQSTFADGYIYSEGTIRTHGDFTMAGPAIIQCTYICK